MAQINCNCALKDQMISEMQNMRKQSPKKENEWVEWLFPTTKGPNDEPLCCLLTYLFYYGYCKECSRPLSEEARSVLAPLMEGKHQTRRRQTK